MKILLLTLIFIFHIHHSYSHRDPLESIIQEIIESTFIEVKKIKERYHELIYKKQFEIKQLNVRLDKVDDPDLKLDLLIKKINLKEELNNLHLKEESDISKIRYLKGLQIIKLLYDKALSLDHHFSAVSTMKDINNISNPNHYPEFINIKESLKNERKSGFNLTPILGENIYTSVIYSFVSLFSKKDISKKEKERNIEQIECILDFTLSMHNDLNTIYFETAYLQNSNDNMIKSIEKLFDDFTKPIGYKTNLIDCRLNDDWDSIKSKLELYLEKMNFVLIEYETQYTAKKMLINLEFTIDRLLQFIYQYNSFINQCEKYYKKFAIMLDSYKNKQLCASKIPDEFNRMKENIFVSINKFNTAYKPVEVNGSKLKELLYGINEFD